MSSQAPSPIPEIERVSTALQKLVRAASNRIGTDCYLHAALGLALLERLGIRGRLVAGFSAWRVGPGDGDVITHAPHPEMVVPTPQHVAYHAWIELPGDKILDLSTYQLPIKAQQLDQQDGGSTMVNWHPDYLLASKSRCMGHRAVGQAKDAPAFYYERNYEIEARLRLDYTLDPEDVEAAWMVVQNPDVKVFGPNDMKETPRSRP